MASVQQAAPDHTAEQVLVVPTALFHRLGHFQGFSRDVAGYLDELLAATNTQFLVRAEAELDPNFKQLIPYCIFRHVDRRGAAQLFQYTRGRGQGEARLHSKRSIGVGGHISLDDVAGSAGAAPYEAGLARELAEEVVIEAPYTVRCVGLINDDESDVGRVHLGVVHLFDVEKPDVRSRETELIDSGFRPVEELVADQERFETWSQICLRALFS